MAVFVLSYNPRRWSWGPRREQWERLTADGGTVTGDWTVGSRTGGITPHQDRAFLFRQGPGPRGIMGSGTFVTGVFQAPHWDPHRPGRLSNYADIRWDVLLADEELLPVAAVAALVPGLPWLSGIQGSGVLLRPPGDEALERLWAAHVASPAQAPR